MNREKLLSVAVIVLGVAVVFLAYKTFVSEPAAIVAQSIQLVDQQGNQRALVAVSPEGVVAVTPFDKDKRERATMGLLEDGEPHVVLRDKDGKAVWGAP